MSVKKTAFTSCGFVSHAIQGKNDPRTDLEGWLCKRALHGALPHETAICFVPIASFGVPEGLRNHEQSLAYLEEKGFVLRVVNLDDTREMALEKLSNCHAIYVEGGNPTFLSHWLASRDLFGPIAELVRSGKPYIGSSAGAMIMGNSLALKLTRLSPWKEFRPQKGQCAFETLGLEPNWVIIPHMDPTAPDHLGLRILLWMRNLFLLHKKKLRLVALPNDASGYICRNS